MAGKKHVWIARYITPYTLEASEVKYVNRVFKKTGIDVKGFTQSLGLSSLKEFGELNPDWNIQALVGLSLEYVDESLNTGSKQYE